MKIKLGTKQYNDSRKEEYTYTVGYPGNIPIALFLIYGW